MSPTRKLKLGSTATALIGAAFVLASIYAIPPSPDARTLLVIGAFLIPVGLVSLISANRKARP